MGVAGYDIYRNGSLAKTVTGATTSWTDTGLQPSTAYTYTVDAFDAVPNTSVRSAPATTTTLAPATDTTAPTVPAGVTATAISSSSVTVSWTASTDAVGVAGYDIYRNGSLAKTVTGATTSWTDTGLQPSTAYTLHRRCV